MIESNRQSGIVVPGLVVPGSKEGAFHSGGIILPTNKTDGRVVLPGQVVTLSTGLTMPTDSDLTSFGMVTEKKKVKKRTATEFALAFDQPHLFIANEAEKYLPTNSDRDIRYVLTILRSQKEETYLDERFDAEVMDTKRDTEWFYNKQTGTREITEKTNPGALEQVGIAVTNLLDDTELSSTADITVLAPLARLLQEFRIHTGFQQELPRMDTLTTILTEKLDNFPTNRKVRYGIYDILSQISIPVSLEESLIEKMDAYKDLEHPQAFKSTVKLQKSKTDAEWLEIQEERRNHLLEKLGGSNQTLFDNFDTLLDESRGLAFSGDPYNAPSGKVGMEVELELNEATSLYDTLKNDIDVSDVGNELGLGDAGWKLGVDDLNYEIRKSSQSLEYGIYYYHDLIALSQWIKDYGKYGKSVHIHLDRTRHAEIPDMRHLFHADVDGRAAVGASGHYYTWEIRSLNLPRANGTMHAGRMSDVIALYIGASSLRNSPSVEKLHIDDDEKVSKKRMIWGHIASFISDPEDRLAALMALHDTMALASVNPLSFIHSVKKESVPAVVEKMRPQFTSEEDRYMLDVLAGYMHATPPPVTDDENSSMYVRIASEILGHPAEHDSDILDYMDMVFRHLSFLEIINKECRF